MKNLKYLIMVSIVLGFLFTVFQIMFVDVIFDNFILILLIPSGVIYFLTFYQNSKLNLSENYSISFLIISLFTFLLYFWCLFAEYFDIIYPDDQQDWIAILHFYVLLTISLPIYFSMDQIDNRHE